jgi:hypothetical protein
MNISMSLLQFIVIIASVIFLIFALDLYQRKKINALHIIVFVGGSMLMILFTINAEFLNRFGRFFGAARGADVLVYISIIILMYLYFELLNKSVKDDYHLTNLISHTASQKAYEEYVEQIHSFHNQSEYDEYIFFVRAYNEYKTIG